MQAGAPSCRAGRRGPGRASGAQSPHSPAPRPAVHIFHEGFPPQLRPRLPAKLLCAPTSWLASASINTSSLRGLGLWGQRAAPLPCPRPPAALLPLMVLTMGPGSPERAGAGRGPSSWMPGCPREELDAPSVLRSLVSSEAVAGLLGAPAARGQCRSTLSPGR